MKINIWDKFYKINEDNSLEFIRLKKIKSDILIMVDSNKNTIKIKPDELKEKYKKLIPDGTIVFNIVSVGDIKDVVVSMFRRKDILNGANIPYCICRQHINDLYSQFDKSSGDDIILGCSITTVQTSDIEIKNAMIADTVFESKPISFYIDDKLDDILSAFDMNNFNDVLFEYHKRFSKIKGIHGLYKNVKSLLTINGFMSDVMEGFSFVSLNIDMKKYNESTALDFEKKLKSLMAIPNGATNLKVIKYNKEMDLEKIDRDHLLLRDFNEDNYIILYDIISVDAVESINEIKQFKNDMSK